jgi:hypothetical protein
VTLLIPAFDSQGWRLEKNLSSGFMGLDCHLRYASARQGGMFQCGFRSRDLGMIRNAWSHLQTAGIPQLAIRIPQWIAARESLDFE